MLNLSDEEEKHLPGIIEELGGFIPPFFMSVVEDYCRLLARKEKAQKQIQEHGELVGGTNGFPVVNPWLQIERQASSDLTKIIKVLHDHKTAKRPWGSK